MTLRGRFSVEAPKPHSDSFSGRFGSDSGGLPGCNSGAFGLQPLRLLNALNSEDRGLKVRFSLAMIVFDRHLSCFSVKCYRRKGKTHLQTPILTI